jgi:DedD protein
LAIQNNPSAANKPPVAPSAPPTLTPLSDDVPPEVLARSQIAKRLGLGLVMIAALLGVLYLVENQLNEPVEPEPITKTETPSESTKDSDKETPQVIGQNVPTPEPAPPIPSAAPVEPDTKPIEAMPPKIEEPPEAVAKPTRSAAKPVGYHPPPSSTSGSGIRLAPLATPSVIPAPAKPVATAIKPVESKLTPAGPRLFGAYLVQAGMFSNTQKAEELHAMLQLNGIPSTLETRVQVGPFNSKAEADAAREKLKALGVESILLPPRK